MGFLYSWGRDPQGKEMGRNGRKKKEKEKEKERKNETFVPFRFGCEKKMCSKEKQHKFIIGLLFISFLGK